MKQFLKKKKFLIPFSIVLLLAFDVRLKVVTYRIDSEKVENPIRICLLTDLHGCYYGKNQKTLVSAIEKENPDLILLGGDIFDDVLSYENAEILLKAISSDYPCYYVTGNHEYWTNEVDVILEIIRSYDIKILEGSHELIEINGEMLNICGISDPDNTRYLENQDDIYTQLEKLDQEIDPENYTVLLSHRPELIEDFLQYSYDLVLSGHAHGGQWRIPFVLNGVYAPNQGIFPKYAGGFYSFTEMDFIVSRGLARETTKIPRIFNRPELVFIDIC